MKCEACGDINPAGNRFCRGCGESLSVLCEACRRASPPGARFCGGCGSPLRSPPPAEPKAPPPAPGALGELKQVTVLFADLVSSTELVARLDPEAAMQQLKPVVARMREAVERFDGTVVRTLGDGVMALFGAPAAKEGHALLACQAAIAMRDSFARQGGALSIRVGLHSGEVVADAPVADPTGERGAHGLTIHLASRLPAEVQAGEICISAETHRLVRPFCLAVPLGQRSLRGVPVPVGLYRLRELRSTVASEQFIGQELTPFRGRDHELVTLQRALTATMGGVARVIGIVGGPGSGKSRLCFEFAECCRTCTLPVFEVRAQLYGHATPLQPVLDLLRLLIFGATPDDEPQAARFRIAACLAELGPAFEGDGPLLCDILGLADPAAALSHLTPNARQARLMAVFRSLVAHRARTPCVVIIEDLHWLDDASEAFIEALVDVVSGTRTMLLLNYRPTYSASWMQRAFYQQIPLPELSAEDTEAMVAELIGAHTDLQDLRLRVSEKSGGNPFFVEEMVRSLVESGSLLGPPGAYQSGAAPDSILPPTVQAVIGARIDRLQERERTLLQIGAIIGKDVPLSVLREVACLPPEDFASALAHLCDAGLLLNRTSAKEPSCSFRHPLIQEVAYTAQLRGRRRDLHAAVARAMERYYAGRIEEFAGLIAHHLELAGLSLGAAQYGARAAVWVGSTSSAQALKHWRKVRALLQEQPRNPETDSQRIMASGQIAWLGWREGLTSDEAEPYIHEALTWARETDDSMITLLMFVKARIDGASGGPADIYVAQITEALSLLRQPADVGRAATLYASLCQGYGWAGLLRQGLAAGDEAMLRVPQIEISDHRFLGYSVQHWATSLRGRILVRLGRSQEARDCFDVMLAIDPAMIDPTVQFIAHLGYVDLAWCTGDAPLAAHHAARIGEMAQRHGSPYLQVFASTCRGTAKALAGDVAGAIADLSTGLATLRRARVAMEYEAEILASLAEAWLDAGKPAKALAAAEETLRTALRLNARMPECRGAISHAAALLQTEGAERLDDAKAAFDRARDLIAETGASVFLARLHRETARLAMTLSPAAIGAEAGGSQQ